MNATGATSSVVERWPELFEGLSERQVVATVRALVATQAEGLEPEFEDVKALTDVSRGAMSHADYLGWARRYVEERAVRGEPR